MASNATVGGRYPPYTLGLQGFPYSSVASMSNPWQLCTSQNPGYSFSNVGNATLGAWNSVALHAYLS